MHILENLLLTIVFYGVSAFGQLYLVDRLLQLRMGLVQYMSCWLIVMLLFNVPLFLSWDHPVLTAYLLQVIAVAVVALGRSRGSLIQSAGASGIAFIIVYIVFKTFFITGSTTTFNSLLSPEKYDSQTLMISLAGDAFLLAVCSCCAGSS
ncbi:hypothetical protein [Paenibacillus sp. MMS20-IR301]|uniref:hypothetical protein n=1 Tax=Paenibacillus sp. MMS20-IR301 TaxID=2895946 RepID=UPI0028E205E8|nr:hypothetical protein [Paenibacillus sp. MMS20-IR301]WNS40771.1 hypothetical protein LOS79_17070 [Paenibacillus sp. MMS20-IR301]